MVKTAKAASTPSAHRLSALAVTDACKQVAKATTDTWRLAPKAPMFTRKLDPKKPKRYRTDKKTGKKIEIKTTRTNRLVAGHAFKVCASGAAYSMMNTIGQEASRLRLKINKESKRVPWLPSYNRGAIAAIEQILSAYGGEAFWNAVVIRKGLNTHKRTTPRMLQMGFARTRKSVIEAGCPVPRTVIITKLMPKSSKKTAKGAAASADADPDAANVSGDEEAAQEE